MLLLLEGKIIKINYNRLNILVFNFLNNKNCFKKKYIYIIKWRGNTSLSQAVFLGTLIP